MPSAEDARGRCPHTAIAAALVGAVSQSGRVPARGTRVQVKGKVNEFAVVGGRSIGLHLREEDRTIRS